MSNNYHVISKSRLTNKFPAASLCVMLLIAVLPFHGVSQIQMSQGSANSDTTLRIIPAQWEKIPVERSGHWVNDLENALTNTQEKHLDSLLQVMYKKTTIELFLVTVDTSMSRKETFDDLGIYLMQNWFAGADSNSYGGIVLISKGLRKIRVFSNENLAQFISDEEMRASIEQGYMPGFRKGDFYAGTKDGTTMLTITLRKNFKKWADSQEAK